MQISGAARKIVICLILAIGPGLSFADFLDVCTGDQVVNVEASSSAHSHHGGDHSAPEVPVLDECCESCASMCASGGCGSTISLTAQTYPADQSAIPGGARVDAIFPSAPPDLLLRPPIRSL